MDYLRNNLSETYLGGKVLRHCEMLIASEEIKEYTNEGNENDHGRRGLDFERLAELLIQYSRRISTTAKETASIAHLQEIRKRTTVGKPNKAVRRCYHCGKAGHYKRDCPELKRNNNSPQERLSTGRGADRDPRAGSRVRFGGNEMVAMMEEKSVQEECLEEDMEFIVDTGATCHTCVDGRGFTPDTQEGDTTLEFNNNTQEGNLKKGTARIKFNDTEVKVAFTSVVSTPGMKYNVLSVSRLFLKGIVTLFDAKKVTLKREC
jgi:hypothetical protein